MQFGKIMQTSWTPGSQDSDSIPSREEADKLDFEQWPHVRRLRQWKKAVFTGSTQPQRATNRLAEIDQATSMQELDNVGIVFGNFHVRFITSDPLNVKVLVKIMNPELKRKHQ